MSVENSSSACVVSFSLISPSSLNSKLRTLFSSSSFSFSLSEESGSSSITLNCSVSVSSNAFFSEIFGMSVVFDS